MKYLIVNGDDFGASAGITRGILRAFRDGILTSTSFMVNMPASGDAARLAREVPELSIGLHVNFTNEGDPLVDLDDVDACRAELHRQFHLFQQLLGRLPTHLDAHHNIHRAPQLLPLFLGLSLQYGLPLREHSPVRYFPSFYAQWDDGQTHLEQVSVETLLDMLETEVREGFTELSCHPGYIDPDFRSVYAHEREAELRTLCDPRVRAKLEALQIRLMGFGELRRSAA